MSAVIGLLSPPPPFPPSNSLASFWWPAVVLSIRISGQSSGGSYQQTVIRWKLFFFFAEEGRGVALQRQRYTDWAVVGTGTHADTEKKKALQQEVLSRATPSLWGEEVWLFTLERVPVWLFHTLTRTSKRQTEFVPFHLFYHQTNWAPAVCAVRFIRSCKRWADSKAEVSLILFVFSQTPSNHIFHLPFLLFFVLLLFNCWWMATSEFGAYDEGSYRNRGINEAHNDNPLSSLFESSNKLCFKSELMLYL